MTKQQAMDFAISVGKPIRHNSFSKGEFVRYKGKELIDEEGTILPQHEFWAIRSGRYWEMDGKNIKMIDMTREEANNALPTMQAFAEGKVIQMLDDRSIWTDLTEREGLPIGTLGESPNIFRIKPAPKYRPFKDAKECWQEMQKHQPFGWLKLKCEDTAYGMLTLIKDKGAAVGIDDTPFSYRYLFYNYTFADRQPFGIKEER